MTRWERFKCWLWSSRVLCAIHVLRGRPIIYGWTGTIYLARPLELPPYARAVGLKVLS